MAEYRFQAPNGKELLVQGERAPTEGELYGMFSQAYPDDASFQETVFERIGSGVGSAAQATTGLWESATRYAANVIGKAGMLAAPAAVNLVGPLKAARALKEVTEEALPTLPQARESFLAGDAMSAVGSLAGAVTTGVVAGPAAAMTVMFGAEAQDAYDAEMARQVKAGEERNADKAIFKSIAYGAGATAIEYKLGAGYILRRIAERFGKQGAKEVADVVAKEGWAKAPEVLAGTGKGALAGGITETLQSAYQQKIVEGDVNWKKALREGAAGAFGEGLAGGAVAVLPRRPGEPQPPVLDNTPDKIVPATTEALGAVTGATEDTTEPEAQSEPITGVTEAVQRANAPSEAPLSTAAETAVAAETTTQTTGGTDGLREETREEGQQADEVVSQETTATEATQTETPPVQDQTQETSPQIQPPIIENVKKESKSTWRKEYIPTSNPASEEWARGEIDRFDGDYVDATRKALRANMTEEHKNHLLTEIMVRAGKRSNDPLAEEQNRIAFRMASDAMAARSTEQGQALESLKRSNERLTPFAAMRSYVTQGGTRLQGKIKRRVGDPEKMAQDINSGFQEASDIAAEQLADIITDAGPAIAAQAQPPPPAAASNSEVKQALEELKQAASKLISLGAVGDGQQMAKDQVAVIAALFKLAKAAIKAGVKTVEDFAKLIGVKVSASVRKVWDQANAGDTPPTMEPAEIADMTEAVRAKYSQPNRTARSLISEFARIQSDTLSYTTATANKIRSAFFAQVKDPQSDSAFIGKLVGLKVDKDLAERLAQLANTEIRSRQAVKTAKESQRPSPQDAAAESAIDSFYNKKPTSPRKENPEAKAVRKAIANQTRDPVSDETFVSILVSNGVSTGIAERLAVVVRLKHEQRNAERLAKQRAQAPKEDRTAQSIINEFARIQSDTPSMRGSNQSAVRKAFQAQIQNPQSDEAFTSTLVGLKVSPEAAARLAQLARREVASRGAVEFQKERAKAQQIISGEIGTIKRLLAKAGVASGVDWRDLFQTSQSNQSARKAELTDKVISDPKLSKLTQSEKRQLARAIDAAWSKLRERVFTQEFNKLVPLTTVKPKAKEKVSKQLPRLIRLINLGALDSAELSNAIAEEYGLTPINTETVEKLKELAEKAQNQKYASQQNKIYHDMIKVMMDSGDFSVWEAIRDGHIWFAHVLMRVGTFENVIIGSGTAAAARVLLEAADRLIVKQDPSSAWRIMAAFIHGMSDGFWGAGEVLRGNNAFLPDARRRVDELMAKRSRGGDLLEAWLRKGKILGYSAFTRRIMTALDYIPAQGARDAGMIYAALSRGDQEQIDKVDRVFDRKNAERARKEARIIAGPKASRAEVNAIARDILEEGIDPVIKEGAIQIGREVAANADPAGISGVFYRMIAGLPFMAKALTGLPFLRSMLNMIAINADFVPGVGAATYYRSSKGFRDKFDKDSLDKGIGRILALDLPPERRRIAMTAQLAGLAFTVAGMGWALSGEDDEEREFEMSGGWKNVTAKQAVLLKEAGQIPYGFRLSKKGRWYSYKMFPVAAILAMIGAVRDNRRFDKEKWNERQIVDQMLYAWWSGVTYVKDLAGLSQISYIFGGAAGQTEEFELSELNKLAARVFGRFAGGFVPSIIREAEDFMDPRLRIPAKDDMLGQWARNFPVLGRIANEPAINYFGEDVELTRPPMRGIYTVPKAAPEHVFLAKLMGKGIFPPHAGKTAKIVVEERNANGELELVSRRMTDPELRAYTKAFGQRVKEEIIDKMTDWENESPEFIKKKFEKLRATASKHAKRELGMILEETAQTAE